ncbi:MAG: hypothetical protein ACREJG_13595 [Candidatus Rokuibacteriota bacterium]
MTVVTAQTADVTGRIERVVPDQQVIVLSNGEIYRVTPNTIVYVDSLPMAPSALKAGQTVVIRSGEAVRLQDGQYVVVQAPPAVGATATAVPTTRQTVYGQVTDVDKDGEITIKTAKGEFEVRFSPDAGRTVKKGDTVHIDVTVMPPGTMPAASPPTRR